MATTRSITRLLLAVVAAFGFAIVAVPASAQPYGGTEANSGAATASATAGAPGQAVNVSGSGFQPNSPVAITFESTPVTLATITADAAGAVAAAVTIPSTATAGSHTIRLSGADPSGQPRVLVAPFTVSGSLPTTGTNGTGRIVAIALTCVALGAVLLVVVRRRRRTA